MWKAALFVLLASLALSPSSVAEDKPTRVEPDVATQNLINRIDPAVPPLAKAAGIGGTVVADIVIDASGRVSSVVLISGHPMLAPAFIETVKKWTYKPFFKDGKPIPVVTRVEWAVSSPEYSQAQEKALKDYYPTFQACYQLVRQGKDAEAESKCGEAVALSDQLPDSRVLERSDSRVFLGHVLFNERKFLASIPLYEKAVEIRKPYEKSDRDADFASENASLGRAYAAVGRLPEADIYYSRAVTIYRAAIVNLPEMKSNYAARLKSTMLEYAKLKAALGQNEEASRLEREASQL